MELSFDELVLAVKGEILVDNENRNFNNVNTDTRKKTLMVMSMQKMH